MRRGQICGPGTARPLPRPRHLAEDPRGCAAAGTPQVQQPLASRRLLLCLCLRVHFGHYQQGSQIVPSTLADSGRNRRSLPIQWSRPIWFWCSLHACSDAPVRRDSARHYAVRFCPWSRDIFAGTGVKAQVVAERYRTELLIRGFGVRVPGGAPVLIWGFTPGLVFSSVLVWAEVGRGMAGCPAADCAIMCASRRLAGTVPLSRFLLMSRSARAGRLTWRPGWARLPGPWPPPP